MNKAIENHLSVMLEGYEGSLKGVSEYISQATEQMKTAGDQKVEIEVKIAELKDLLGLSNEDKEQAEVDGVAHVIPGPGAELDED